MPPFGPITGKDPADRDRAVAHAAEALRDGRVVILPTETVYGLFTRATTAAVDHLGFERAVGADHADEAEGVVGRCRRLDVEAVVGRVVHRRGDGGRPGRQGDPEPDRNADGDHEGTPPFVEVGWFGASFDALGDGRCHRWTSRGSGVPARSRARAASHARDETSTARARPEAASGRRGVSRLGREGRGRRRLGRRRVVPV